MTFKTQTIFGFQELTGRDFKWLCFCSHHIESLCHTVLQEGNIKYSISLWKADKTHSRSHLDPLPGLNTIFYLFIFLSFNNNDLLPVYSGLFNTLKTEAWLMNWLVSCQWCALLLNFTSTTKWRQFSPRWGCHRSFSS